MGIGASKVIANLLLSYFDREIENEIKPIYYGRYADDIFLVIEDGSNITSPEEFWEFLNKRIKNIHLKKSSESEKDSETKSSEYEPLGHILKVPFAADSLLEFSSGKVKYFFLEGEGGGSFLRTLKETLDENSSEWKLPPDSDEDVEKFSKAMTEASSNTNETANGLRKSDGLSIQRMKFILYLKRFEVAIDLLPKKVWGEAIQEFFNVVTEYTITPEAFANFSRYFPRVLSLAVKARDKRSLSDIFTKTVEAFSFLGAKAKAARGYTDECLQYSITKATEYQIELLLEGVYSSLDPSLEESEDLDMIVDYEITKHQSSQALLAAAKKLFFADLHKKPFKDAFIFGFEYGNFERNIFTQFEKFQFIFEELPHSREFNILVKQLSNTFLKVKSFQLSPPRSLYFYTRPFTILELTIIFPNWIDFQERFKIICSFYHLSWLSPVEYKEGKTKIEDYKVLNFTSPYTTNNRTFALTSLETKDESWIALVREDGFEPDADRVQRILNLSRDILKCNRIIHYVVFPELSIPKKLLIYISGLFMFRRISIIAGFEYEKISIDDSKLPDGSKGFVSNQLLYVLCIADNFGFHQVVLKQEKKIPALNEERMLFNVGGKHLKALNNTKLIINHDNFWFSGLICNDLLNINYRANLRGLIDALIVIEWNKDVNTYNALVEASANDIHAFILQINNRLYGDTRLRAPYKDDFKRDVVRVRGGELDYFVVATLEVTELRKFQSSHRSPEKPFKPVPTGYEISISRKYSQKDEQ